jgi:hypothetical protein
VWWRKIITRRNEQTFVGGPGDDPKNAEPDVVDMRDIADQIRHAENQLSLTNLPHGWYLTTSPVITANWLAAPGEQWIVPIGGGFGRIFKIGEQPVSANIAGYYNAIRPTGTPDWLLRAQLSLLFPTK